MRTPDGRHPQADNRSRRELRLYPAVGHAVGSDFREAPSDFPKHAIPQMLNDHAGEREIRWMVEVLLRRTLKRVVDLASMHSITSDALMAMSKDDYQVLLTILYCSTDRLRRGGAAV
ncbi:hypothetical protein ACVIHH_000056 [Bradyrhizobium sp. USDA 4518]